MSGAGWRFAARRAERDVEVMATAHPSGAAYLLVFAGGLPRIARAYFLPRGGPPRWVPAGAVPSSVTHGAGGERAALVDGW